jgi:adenine-specific DNA-methyltransferase
MTTSVRYMGSKRSLAPQIAQQISRQHPKSAVLDAFSGMCAVGSELAPRHALLTNDVHAFAEVVARALFVASSDPPTSLIARNDLNSTYSRNRRFLRELVGDRLARESAALSRLNEAGGWKKLLQFTEAEHQLASPFEIPGAESLRRYRATPTLFPYCLATSYYSSSYFGLEQCVDIDSLRFAIDQASPTYRPYYLCALIHAMSHCAAAPGHFAQFLVPRDKANTKYVGRIRNRSVIDRFYLALDSMPRIPCLDRSRNNAFCSDATALLRRGSLGVPSDRLVIYADPPYSKAQYSRYYHVLETIVLYDYPECTGKGRYRHGRFQTDFSQKAGVRAAFEAFVAGAAEVGTALYLSYPTNGLLCDSGLQIPELLARHYDHVEIAARVRLNHSTMGGAPGHASVAVFEEVHYASHH